jgi:hypothetical protein
MIIENIQALKKDPRM